MLRDIWDWIRAVVKQWQLLTTGGLVTAVIVAIQYARESSISWTYAKWVLAFFVVSAFFKAWRAERHLRLKQSGTPDDRLVRAITYGEELSQKDNEDNLAYGWWFTKYQAWLKEMSAYSEELHDPDLSLRFRMPDVDYTGMGTSQMLKAELKSRLDVLRAYRDRLRS